MQETAVALKQTPKNKSVMSRVINIAVNTLAALIVLAAIGVIIVSIQSKAAGVTPSIGGYKILKVISGSMEPTIQTGSVILIKQTEPDKLKVGDIITFRSMEYGGQLVTHRIAGINKGDLLTFETKGDANDSNDNNPTYASDIKGVEVLTIPLLGYIMDFIQSRQGILLMIIIPGIALIIYESYIIIKSLRIMKREKEQPARLSALREDLPAADKTGEQGQEK